MERARAAAAASREELGDLRSRRRELEATAAGLSSALTAEELAAQLASTRAAVEASRAKLARLTGPGAPALVTPEQRAAAVATLHRFRRAWAERKRMVCDVLDAMAEGLERKPRELADAIGIETDEDAKVSIRDFTLP